MNISVKHIGFGTLALCVIAAAALTISWPYLSARSAYGELRAKYVNSLGIDFEALKAENPDTVGWIQIDDTVIDYPVVKGEADEYLDLAFDKTESKAGTLFLDPMNKADLTDKVNFIYGHSLLDGSMFSCIPDYADQGYFERHRSITLVLPDRELSLTPWAALRQPGDDGTLHVGVFDDEEAWTLYKNHVANHALARGERDASSIDRLVCLVTCSYNSLNERTLLFCSVD